MTQENRQLQEVVRAPEITFNRLQRGRTSTPGFFINDKNGGVVPAQSPDFWASLRVSF